MIGAGANTALSDCFTHFCLKADAYSVERRREPAESSSSLNPRAHEDSAVDEPRGSGEVALAFLRVVCAPAMRERFPFARLGVRHVHVMLSEQLELLDVFLEIIPQPPLSFWPRPFLQLGEVARPCPVKI